MHVIKTHIAIWLIKTRVLFLYKHADYQWKGFYNQDSHAK